MTTTPSDLQQRLQPLVESATNAQGHAKQAAEVLANARALTERMPTEEMLQSQPARLLVARELARKARKELKETAKGLTALIDSLL